MMITDTTIARGVTKSVQQAIAMIANDNLPLQCNPLILENEMTAYKITDSGDPRKYFTMIPNIIDDLDLSPYAFRLYVHLKRVAGDNGTCYQTQETLAAACKMSEGSISNAKKELVAAGLISITEEPSNAGRPNHHIEITDVWEINANNFQRSPDEQQRSPRDLQRSPHEIKNNPIKNNNKAKIAGAIFACGSGEPPQAYSPAKKEIPTLEKEIMDAYGRKRRLNQLQRGIVTRISQLFPDETIRQWLAWCVVSEIPLGKALNSATLTLSKWGKPKAVVSKGRKGSHILDPGETPMPIYPQGTLENDPLYQQLFGFGGKNA